LVRCLSGLKQRERDYSRISSAANPFFEIFYTAGSRRSMPPM
jgi:hypothetical protein